MKCPVCRTNMKWYLPGRWVCTNIKLHDAATARAKLGGVSYRGRKRPGKKGKRK